MVFNSATARGSIPAGISSAPISNSNSIRRSVWVAAVDFKVFRSILECTFVLPLLPAALICAPRSHAKDLQVILELSACRQFSPAGLPSCAHLVAWLACGARRCATLPLLHLLKVRSCGAAS